MRRLAGRRLFLIYGLRPFFELGREREAHRWASRPEGMVCHKSEVRLDVVLRAEEPRFEGDKERIVTEFHQDRSAAGLLHDRGEARVL